MNIEDLKIMQLQNQHLLKQEDYMTVIHDLCGIQAQFLSNSFHAINIRSNNFKIDDTVNLMKSWTIRGTMHVFAEEDLPLFLHEGRKHFLRPCDTLEEDECITRERKQYFADLIVDSIASGTVTRDELRTVCTMHSMTEKEAESVFNSWGGTIRALCESGEICYNVQEKKSYRLCPPFVPLEKDIAELELARRYFKYYAPATIKDAAYFFAATQTQVKKWISKLPVTSFSCNRKEYFSIGEKSADGAYGIPECLFLAGFDPLMLGYQKKESLYLTQEHLRKIFTLSGIIVPSVLLRGRIVGKWKRKGGILVINLFEPLRMQEKQCIEAQAEMLWSNLRSIEFSEE